MVFYHPQSETSRLTLRFAQGLAEQYGDRSFAVVGLAVTGDTAAVQKVQDDLKLTFPSLAGKSLLRSYEVDATPRFVLVDGEGIVRGAYTGWGPEIPAAVTEDLKRCLPRTEVTNKPPVP
jgi:cytochrome oxidase Cu insertion factor (SCO1/SenC/PrrC family)